MCLSFLYLCYVYIVSTLNHDQHTEEELSDYSAASKIWDQLVSWIPESRWLERIMDPRYVIVDWNAAPPANYASVPGTLTTALNCTDGGPAVLPIVGGGRQIQLAVAGNYNVLICSDKTAAGILIGHINQAHRGLADMFHAVTNAPLEKY